MTRGAPVRPIEMLCNGSTGQEACQKIFLAGSISGCPNLTASHTAVSSLCLTLAALSSWQTLFIFILFSLLCGSMGACIMRGEGTRLTDALEPFFVCQCCESRPITILGSKRKDV
jgi:hypothetical protein